MHVSEHYPVPGYAHSYKGTRVDGLKSRNSPLPSGVTIRSYGVLLGIVFQICEEEKAVPGRNVPGPGFQVLFVGLVANCAGKEVILATTSNTKY